MCWSLSNWEPLSQREGGRDDHLESQQLKLWNEIFTNYKARPQLLLSLTNQLNHFASISVERTVTPLAAPAGPRWFFLHIIIAIVAIASTVCRY